MGENCNLGRIRARIGKRPRFGPIHSHVCGCGLCWKNIFLPLEPHIEYVSYDSRIERVTLMYVLVKFKYGFGIVN
jgi:hypothetical protein